ncbi:SusC/RagA family TonB-linked outer membrane protein [Flavobacteriaceae bacterium]|nr:SusC/RagA family TonB-linked outer membrane protein [Flavobacteriaceae bacterium]
MKTKFKLISTSILFMFGLVAFAQQTVTGTVTDEFEAPIIGATLSVDGTSNVVTTDFDGNYTIVAADGEILVVSYVGYNTIKIQVEGSTLDVVLSSSTALDEVIVSAYGETTKAKSTNATVKITAETISNRPNASLIQTLTGQVAGLDVSTNSGAPGSNSLIELRGTNSINGNTEPLILLDGTPIDEDDFRALNPNEIERLDVLKDAGATAIYGNRGANGVILITTKRGEFNQPLKVSVSSSYAISTVQDDDFDMMNASEILTLEKQLTRGLGSTLTDEEIAAYGDGYNWRDYFWREGQTYNHNVTLTSGGPKSSQLTSIGYYEQEGITITTSLKRFNLRNNFNTRSDNGKFRLASSLSLNFAKSGNRAEEGGSGINRNIQFGPQYSLPYVFPSDKGNDPSAFGDAKGLSVFQITPLILMDLAEKTVRDDEETKIIYNLDTSYDITDNITFRSVTGLDYAGINNLYVQPSDQWSSVYFEGTDDAGLAGYQDLQHTDIFSLNQTTSLTWDTTFDEKHSLTIAAFTEYFKAHYKTFGYRSNGLNPKTYYPGDGSSYVDDNSSNDVFADSTNANLLNAGLFSYFGSLDYDFDGRFGLTATARRDASYRFSQSNRWGTFGSIGLRWNVSDEEFMQNTPFDYLKLRTSYGTNGNQRINGGGYFTSPDLYESLYSTGTGYQGQVSTFVSQIPNNTLKWETVTQFNIGAEFSVLNNLINGEIDVYFKKTDDLYQSKPVSAINAITSLSANVGGVENNGVDLLLNVNLIKPKGDDFGLSFSFNGNYNDNNLYDIPADTGYIIGIGRNGGPIGELYTIRYAGVNPANGNLLFYTKDNQLTESPNADTDRVWTNTTSVPDYFGGISSKATYKGFTFQTQFNFATGVNRFDNNMSRFQSYSSVGRFNMSKDVLRAWTPDNRITDMPAYTATNRTAYSSDRFQRNGDYLTLRYASLSYDFKSSVLEGTGIEKLNLFVNGENLLTFSEWRGFDVVARSSSSLIYPNPKTISVGINATF